MKYQKINCTYMDLDGAPKITFYQFTLNKTCISLGSDKTGFIRFGNKGISWCPIIEKLTFSERMGIVKTWNLFGIRFKLITKK